MIVAFDDLIGDEVKFDDFIGENSKLIKRLEIFDHKMVSNGSGLLITQWLSQNYVVIWVILSLLLPLLLLQGIITFLCNGTVQNLFHTYIAILFLCKHFSREVITLLNLHLGIILANRYVYVSVMIENGSTSFFFAIMSYVLTNAEKGYMRSRTCMHLECMHSAETSVDGPSSAIFLV